MSRQLGIELKRSKYRLLGLVGQGQFGRVFCAVHRQTGQFVALKELEQNRFPTHKFLRELRFLLSLQHPNIVTCQSLEHTATGRCLVMDYCEAGTLRSLMSEENRLSLPHSIKLIADILAGLEHAHSRDIVHCDIKPENILLNIEPGGWTARISDFGVARLSQELSKQDGNTGSPAYMAPERFYGQYSQTSDLYAVGVLLFELMVGERPFSGTPASLMSAHLNQPVKIPETVPDIWRPLIITALQKLSARRFRTASEMLDMLRSIATTDESGAMLGAASLSLPLFRSTVTLPTSPLQAQQQQELHQPLHSISPTHEPNAALIWQPTLESAHGDLTAIDKRGRWLAGLTAGSDAAGSALETGTLTIRQVENAATLASRSISVNLELRSIETTQLVVLDSRHVAVIQDSVVDREVDKEGDRESEPGFVKSVPGSLIKVFTRRGTQVGALHLPVQIGKSIPTSLPCQLLAIDRNHAHSVLLIDLKPYRILRLGVGIEPSFLLAPSWGYLIANAAGEMVCFDREFRSIGQLLAPASITAMAAIEPYELLIATWDGQQGCLHSLDLREAGLELLF